MRRATIVGETVIFAREELESLGTCRTAQALFPGRRKDVLSIRAAAQAGLKDLRPKPFMQHRTGRISLLGQDVVVFHVDGGFFCASGRHGMLKLDEPAAFFAVTPPPHTLRDACLLWS